MDETWNKNHLGWNECDKKKQLFLEPNSIKNRKQPFERYTEKLSRVFTEQNQKSLTEKELLILPII